MNIFNKFNRKNINDRQIDTLIGLGKGLIADGKVVQSEAEYLMTWLVQSRQASDNPLIINLLGKVELMLEDGIFDSDESKELLDILHKISGESSELGELAKTSSLPIDDPPPPIVFAGMSFLFTGTCAFGSRKQCQDATELLGGVNANSVTKSLDFLVLGTYVTDSWAHENFGRKIEKAMMYREQGMSLAIVSEEHWADSGSLTVSQSN